MTGFTTTDLLFFLRHSKFYQTISGVDVVHLLIKFMGAVSICLVHLSHYQNYVYCHLDGLKYLVFHRVVYMETIVLKFHSTGEA